MIIDKLTLRRWNQVVTYGWREAATIAKESGKSRVSIFQDIIRSFYKWHLFSNQYHVNHLWDLSEKEKKIIALPLGEENKRRDNWVRDNYHNWKFINKWTAVKYELSPSLQQKRKKAYTKEFNASEGLIVQFNVHIHREHYLDGTIKIGRNVLLAKHVFIDYSGEVIIRDNVTISNGVVIESHEHPGYTNPAKDIHIAIPQKIVIENGVIIGTRAIIHASVGTIGRNARVGADAVLRHSVPPYAIVMGNPAKIVGFSMTPEQVEEYERENYPENERISIEKYAKDYNKLFLNRIDEIKQFLKKSC